ncbi:MAG: portal protein [Akkermansiaceae bacterium]|nr:portal protein [Akkermansiaceae bacterium]
MDDTRDRVHEWKRIAQALLNKRRDERWHHLVRHVLPELIPAAALTEMEDDGLPARLCGRARTDILKLASAHINYITPRGQSWFNFKNPAGDSGTQDADDWYSRATQRVRMALEKSNFYPEQIAAVIDRCATGTGMLLVEDRDGGLHFSHIPAGTYAVAENENHRIDTAVRKFDWTAHQAASYWGADALSPAMRSALQNESERYSRPFEIWHIVLPNDVPDRGSGYVPLEERNWLSIYLDPRENHLLALGGYHEFPYLVSRFLKYGNQVYGTGALAGIQDVMHDAMNLSEALKVAAQRLAIPSVLAAPHLIEELDLRAGGITVMRDDDWQHPPQAFAPAGQYTIGQQLLEMYYGEIDDATFVSVLQTVSQVDREMTATEVNARESERMMTFSQSFTQFASDFEPFMQRVFGCCFRQGLLPDRPPFEAVEQTLTGGIKLRVPQVSYVGLLARALRRAEYSGLMNTIQIAMQFASATGDSTPLDFVKMGEAMRYIADEEMAPEKCLRSPQEIKQRERERQEAQAEAAATQAALQQAQANAAQAQADATINGMNEQ